MLSHFRIPHFNLYLEAVQQAMALAQKPNLVVGRIKTLSRLKMLSYTRKRSKKGRKTDMCVLISIDGLQISFWAAIRKVKLD